MSQYSDSNSIDDAPKAYQCFCCKNYTTYSGIYLHVKFKHTELFNKYKKMKITKLLKKKRLSDGSELYKLENILEQITEPLK